MAYLVRGAVNAVVASNSAVTGVVAMQCNVPLVNSSGQRKSSIPVSQMRSLSHGQCSGKIRASSSRPLNKVVRATAEPAADVVPALADVPLVSVKEQMAGPSSWKIPPLPGIYAIYNDKKELQYIGLSRKLSSSIQAHAEDVPDQCIYVKAVPVQVATRTGLQDAWKVWVQQHLDAAGDVPPGNVSGNKTWTERKPKATKADIRLTPGNNKQLTVSMDQLLDKLVKDIKVLAFIKGSRTAPQCGFSAKVVSILNELKADYETCDVLDEDHNPGLREAIKVYSSWPTIPQVYVNGEFVGGADIMVEMYESGELKKLLSKA
eukprot:jgi/Mesvir1/29429/Mv23011-RA.1